jgi:3-hydroxybutyryl-CoA dehydrogenase
MQKILIIGEETIAQVLRKKLEINEGFEIEVSDGDEEEDFRDYDIIFDLNFDDDAENFPIYAGLRDKLIFLSTVKQTLSESSYIYPEKVRSTLVGINAIEFYLDHANWELSAFRANEWQAIDAFMKKINQAYIAVEDVVGMWRPRRDFLALNETIKLCGEGAIINYNSNPLIQEEFKKIDAIGVTNLFETLMAIYEDTKEIKYIPCTLLKKKYLRNHMMFVGK